MPVSQEDISKVQEASQKARGLAKESSGLYAEAETFSPDVMNMVRAARSERGMSEMEKGFGQATGQLATEPAGIRARTADVNPLQVDLITAQQRGQTLRTLGSLGAQEQSISGTIQEIIGAGVSKVKAMAMLKQAEAADAAAEADELMAMATFRAAREEEEFQRQLSERGMTLQEQQFEWQKSKPTGGGGGGTLEDWLRTQPGGGSGATTPQTTEKEPNYSPVGMVGKESMEGEWYYDPNNQNWRVAEVIVQDTNGNEVIALNLKDPDVQRYEQMGYTTKLRLY